MRTDANNSEKSLVSVGNTTNAKGSPDVPRTPEGGRVQGWVSVCWGAEGFLVPWFLGFWLLFWGVLGFLVWSFLVYWFPDLLVSELLGSEVSKFPGFQNPLVLLKDIGSILPKASHVFYRYWSHLQDFQDFWNGSSFCPSTPFPKLSCWENSKLWDFQKCTFENTFRFSRFSQVSWCLKR